MGKLCGILDASGTRTALPPDAPTIGAAVTSKGINVALADIEQALDPGVPWRTCSVCHYLSEKDDEWGARMRRMLANRGIKFKDIAAELLVDPDEPNIPTEALSRHAQAGCSARELLRPSGKPTPA